MPLIDAKQCLADNRDDLGTTRAPRKARSVRSDGVNDQAALASDLALGTVHSFGGWVDLSSHANSMLYAKTGSEFGLFCDSDTTLRYYNGASTSWTGLASLSTGVQHWFIVRDGTSITLYINGVSQGTKTLASVNALSFRYLLLAAYSFDGSLWDHRIYDVAKSAGQIAAIYASDVANLDVAGLLCGWWGNEESGTTIFDWSGNGRHLTITNADTTLGGTFHAEQSMFGPGFNPANTLGFTRSGDVVLNQNIAIPTQDVSGGALQYTGKAPYPVETLAPCVSGDGAAVYVDLTSSPVATVMRNGASFSFELEFYNTGSNGMIISNAGPGSDRFAVELSSQQIRATCWNGVHAAASSATLSVGWHKLVFAYTLSPRASKLWIDGVLQTGATSPVSSGSQVCELLRYPSGSLYAAVRVSCLNVWTSAVTTGTPTAPQYQVIMQGGPGSGNVNRDLAWVSDAGTGGVLSQAIKNGSVATIWGTRQSRVKDHCVEHGGRLDSSTGAFVPAIPGGTTCADGSSITLPAGTFGNPFSRRNLDPFGAAELVGRGLPSAYANSDDLNALVSPANSAFTGSASKQLLFDDTLSGGDLTDVQNYIA